MPWVVWGNALMGNSSQLVRKNVETSCPTNALNTMKTS